MATWDSFVELETTGGFTRLDPTQIAGVTYNRESSEFSIHMKSGTIFTAKGTKQNVRALVEDFMPEWVYDHCVN